MDINVRVLTTGYWPTQASIPMCVLPQAAQQAFETFKTFYLNKHNGRKITLNPMLGSADVNAIFYGPKAVEEGGLASQQEQDNLPTSSSAADLAKSVFSINSIRLLMFFNNDIFRSGRRHILSVSTYQMCILIQFNNRTRMSFEVS